MLMDLDDYKLLVKKQILDIINLIKEFKNLTGIPMVLNTSFNENEPVVCKPEEALRNFSTD